VRKSHHDWNKIAEDYRGGMTLLQLSEKYKVSISQISYHLKVMGVETRKGPKEWRKLQRVGKQRLVSLPYGLLRQLGFGPDEELWYHWQPEDGERMVLRISKVPDKYRMYRIGTTRMVRFRTDRTENLLGKWTIEDGNLVLTVKPSISES
jgi:DNA-binding transcriptional ArsR family regulator